MILPIKFSETIFMGNLNIGYEKSQESQELSGNSRILVKCQENVMNF